MTRPILTVLLFATAIAQGNELSTPFSFVETHCMDCHDDATAEGDFRADLLTSDLGAEA